MNSPTVETSLTISSSSSELDFEMLSRTFDLAPVSIRFLDHRLPSGRIAEYRMSEWTVSTGVEVLDTIDDGIKNLSRIFLSNWKKLSEICSRKGYGILIISRVTIRTWDDRPFIEISPESINLLNEIQAQWALDWVDFSLDSDS